MDLVPDHGNKVNIAKKKKGKSYEFWGFPVLLKLHLHYSFTPTFLTFLSTSSLGWLATACCKLAPLPNLPCSEESKISQR